MPGVTVLESVEIDQVVADFPMDYKFFEADGIQYAGYYNKERNLTVAARDLETGQWLRKVLPEKVGWDSHNRITMAVDSAGCLHISGNMHNVPLIYYRSEKAGDIQSLTKVFPMVNADLEQHCTYPGFMKNKEGTLLFQYRTGGSGNGQVIYNRYDEETRCWQNLLGQPLFDGQGKMSTYRSGPRLGSDGYYHVTWMWRDTPACETNHDLSYMRSANLKDWETVDGQPITLPVTGDTPGVVVDPVPARGGIINGGSAFALDKSGRPGLAYHKYDEEGHTQVYVALWREGRWLIRQVSDWDYRWAFSGPGSISWEINVGSPRSIDDQHLAVPYRHIKEGRGEFIIDDETGALLGERVSQHKKRESPYPPELQELSSDREGIRVCWSRMIRDVDDPNSSYVLRWEMTNKKQRFYKRPENPVSPSPLVWYRLSK